jgi:23S rRNA (guanosine2251-2'-O)-methyltransferase
MEKEFYLILHNVRSAYNVGAIMRTAEGLGVGKIFLTGYTPAPNAGERPYFSASDKMIAKTALGAEKYLAWERFENLPWLIEKLKKEKIKIIALEQNKKSVDLKKYKSKFPSVLILGNETGGIDSEILNLCDSIISIPMRGRKESFNVSVAAGIASYDILNKN